MFNYLVRMFCGEYETDELSNINVEGNSGIKASSSSSISCGCIESTSSLNNPSKISSRILEDAALKLWSNLNLDRINFNNELIKLTAKLQENIAINLNHQHQNHHHCNDDSDNDNNSNKLAQILSLSNFKINPSLSLSCSQSTSSSILHDNTNNNTDTIATTISTNNDIPLSLTNYSTVSQIARFASAANLFNSSGVDLHCPTNFYTIQNDKLITSSYNIDAHTNIAENLISNNIPTTITSNTNTLVPVSSTTSFTNYTTAHFIDNSFRNQEENFNLKSENEISFHVPQQQLNLPDYYHHHQEQQQTTKPNFCAAQDEGINSSVELKQTKPSTELIKTKQTLYCCSICRQRFHSNTGLRRHNLALHATKAMKCDQCVKVFRHQAALSDHKKRVHGPREYICGICSADFATETYLRSHVRIHDEKRFVCLECKHGFSNPSDLKNHMRIHNDEKPFECEVCGKAFRHVSGFYAHIRIHTGETPYQCELCAKKFSNASNFRMHRRVHTKEMQFRCQTCGKEFIQPSNYSRHLRIHTKEKPYSCNLCSAKFLYSTSLKRHQQRHHGLELLRCQLCQKTFLNESCLIRHRTGCELRACVKTADEELYTHLL
ncbi:unnamed protein product [Schistosoma curassoni]|nr:unnamed protein product [Schistosoma curassoni]